jgi:hypothetical protein
MDAHRLATAIGHDMTGDFDAQRMRRQKMVP